MNIKKALKVKNKLKGKIVDLQTKLYKYNIIEEGQNADYDTRLVLKELNETIIEFIELKTKIQKANLPVFDKIFRLSELKGLAKKVKYVNCDNEKVTRGTTVTNTYAKITAIEKEEIVLKIENEIDEIQDYLDDFNHRTNI
jgi:hypothetical protein